MTTHEKLAEEFAAIDAVKLDPNNEYDWYSITLGWAIGKGLTLDDAENFATYIRYQTDLG